MNIVHICRRAHAGLRGTLRLLLGTTLLAGLGALLADPEAPARWLGALTSIL